MGKGVCLPRTPKGFKLIELLIVVFIIGVLASIVIPTARVSIHRARVKSTMKNISVISKAITNYVMDNGYIPDQSGSYDSNSAFYKTLSPFYIKLLPIKDKWENGFRVWCGSDANGNYGISGANGDDHLVVSFGSDKVKEDDFSFDAYSPEDGLFVLSKMSDFKKDLIMWNGAWIRRPSNIAD